MVPWPSHRLDPWARACGCQVQATWAGHHWPWALSGPCPCARPSAARQRPRRVRLTRWCLTHSAWPSCFRFKAWGPASDSCTAPCALVPEPWWPGAQRSRVAGWHQDALGSSSHHGSVLIHALARKGRPGPPGRAVAVSRTLFSPWLLVARGSEVRVFLETGSLTALGPSSRSPGSRSLWVLAMGWRCVTVSNHNFLICNK